MIRHIEDAPSAGAAAGEAGPVRRHAIGTLRAAADLADTRPAAGYHGHAADGAVTATVAGPRQVTAIRLDPTLRHRLDNVALGEAVRDAVTAAQEHAADTVRQLGLRPSAPLADRPLPDILRGTS